MGLKNIIEYFSVIYMLFDTFLLLEFLKSLRGAFLLIR